MDTGHPLLERLDQFITHSSKAAVAMKGKPVDQLVYEYMFPKPRPADPQSFTAFLQRHLVVEVRHEVQSFYGHLDTAEAKYPGLDYNHRTHRIRLSRWPWHRRLFRAFDGLRLTPNEIAGLTKWEGTKWAKDRYEKEQGITILDTTEDEISHPRSPSDRAASEQPESAEPEEGVDETMADDSDEELASVGYDLNQRLRERVALRNTSGDMSMVIDEEWERWLKDAIETGQLPEIASRIYRETGEVPDIASRLYEQSQARDSRSRETTRPRVTETGISSMDPASVRAMMAAAREGRWDEVPERHHAMLRGVFSDDDDNSLRRVNSSAFRTGLHRLHPRTGAMTRSPLSSDVSSGSMSSRARLPTQYRQQHWSDLRLPSGDGGDALDALLSHRGA